MKENGKLSASGKGLWFATFLLATIVGLQVYFLLSRTPPTPLLLGATPSPQIVSGKRVFTGKPPFYLDVDGVNCLTKHAIDDGEPFGVHGVSEWIRVDDGREVLSYTNRFGFYDPKDLHADGCFHYTFHNPIPRSIRTGEWVLVGTTCVIQNPKDCKSWRTQSFQVIPS